MQQLPFLISSHCVCHLVLVPLASTMQFAFLLPVLSSVSVLQGVFAKFTDNSHNVNPKSVVAGWFAGWHEIQFPAEKVPWKKYTHVIYSFAYVQCLRKT